MHRPFFRKLDCLWLLILLLIAFTGWYKLRHQLAQQLEAQVQIGSKVVMRISLYPGQKERLIHVTDTNIDLQLFADGGIAFVHSDCPDKLCVRTGELKYPGQVAACLPNRVFVRLIDSDKNNEDVPDSVIGRNN